MGRRAKYRRFLKKLREDDRKKQDFQKKRLPIIFLLISLICLLITHFDFNNFYWLFIVGLLIFSFTIAYFLITILEHFLPSALVKHVLWTGMGIGGKGLAGLIYGILAIAIMLGSTYILKIMNVGYVK
jgi:hypothetical protein